MIYLNTVRKRETRVLLEDFYINLLSDYKPYTDPLVLDELLNISKEKMWCTL